MVEEPCEVDGRPEGGERGELPRSSGAFAARRERRCGRGGEQQEEERTRGEGGGGEHGVGLRGLTVGRRPHDGPAVPKTPSAGRPSRPQQAQPASFGKEIEWTCGSKDLHADRNSERKRGHCHACFCSTAWVACSLRIRWCHELQYKCQLFPTFLPKMQKERRITPEQW